MTKKWGWRSWRFLLLFPILLQYIHVLIYTYILCEGCACIWHKKTCFQRACLKIAEIWHKDVSWFSLKPQLCRLPFLSSPFFYTCPASCRSNKSHSMYPSRARWDYILYKMILIRFHQHWKKSNHSSLYNSQAFNPLNINLHHFISITHVFFSKKKSPLFSGRKIPSIHSPSLNTNQFPHIFPAKASDVDMDMASGRSLLPDPSWVWSCKCQHASVAWKPTV